MPASAARVPPLNERSGNPVVAPECDAGPSATRVDIQSGAGIRVATGASGAIKTRGTFKIQRCIHPWTRTTVTVRARSARGLDGRARRAPGLAVAAHDNHADCR